MNKPLLVSFVWNMKFHISWESKVISSYNYWLNKYCEQQFRFGSTYHDSSSSLMPDALSEKYESRIEAETIWFYVTLRQNSVVIKQQYKLTLAPRKRASSSSCLRGSSAAWKCSILTPAPVEDGACYNPCIKSIQMLYTMSGLVIWTWNR